MFHKKDHPKHTTGGWDEAVRQIHVGTGDEGLAYREIALSLAASKLFLLLI